MISQQTWLDMLFIYAGMKLIHFIKQGAIGFKMSHMEWFINVCLYDLQMDGNGIFDIHCPACWTTLVATRFRVAVICPIIQVPHCIRVFLYFVWFVFINHIFQFYYELCTYCNILDFYLS